MGTESGGVEKEDRGTGSGLGHSGRGRSSGTGGTATAEGRGVDTDVDQAPSGENSSAKVERPGKVGHGATGSEAPVDREDASD